MSATMQVTDHGITFTVRFIEKGDRYGLNNVLTVGEGDSLRLSGPGPFVEFYDTRYPHTEFGQFVSRYNVSTILGTDPQSFSGVGGIQLHGGVEDWRIGGFGMAEVRAWLLNVTARVYTVGIPCVVMVKANGDIEFGFDLSEVSDTMDDDTGSETYPEAIVAEDILRVSAAADRLRNYTSVTTHTNA